MEIDIATMLELGEGHARRMLLKDGCKQLTPFYHLVTSDGQHAMIPVHWKDDLEKQLIYAAVKQLSQEMGAVAALFMSESWTVRVVGDDAIAEYERQRREGDVDPPSQDPRRIEVVSIVATNGKETRHRMLRMIRDKPGGELVDLVTEPEKPEGTKSRISSGVLDGIIAFA